MLLIFALPKLELMPQIELKMPKMGESIMEATILNWLKKEGDNVEEDETILEIATDKVDTEIPSPVSGVLLKILHQVDAVVPIGTPIALIEGEGEAAIPAPSETQIPKSSASVDFEQVADVQIQESKTNLSLSEEDNVAAPVVIPQLEGRPENKAKRFYSPLVKSIAKKNNISSAELDTIAGTASKGRVSKQDILHYISVGRKSGNNRGTQTIAGGNSTRTSTSISEAPKIVRSGEDEIIEMGRMRKLIADHMVMSKQTSPHVTSFVEVDVTEIVEWRNRIKENFERSHGEKITYTPIFIESVVKAIHDYPMINISVDGNRIIKKKNIHIGMATALQSGNLIVPVIKHADQHSLLGLTKQVNDLAQRARKNELKPDDIQGGTFTITNVGTFGNVMGTPIINQPQVAILAIGAIRKKPAVIETEKGDFIGIRHLMFMSLSYDHRVVDGFLGGSFLRKIADYLEDFDTGRSI